MALWRTGTTWNVSGNTSTAKTSSKHSQRSILFSWQRHPSTLEEIERSRQRYFSRLSTSLHFLSLYRYWVSSGIVFSCSNISFTYVGSVKSVRHGKNYRCCVRRRRWSDACGADLRGLRNAAQHHEGGRGRQGCHQIPQAASQEGGSQFPHNSWVWDCQDYQGIQWILSTIKEAVFVAFISFRRRGLAISPATQLRRRLWRQKECR